MKEIWKACPGYEGIYDVSSSGRVMRIRPGAGRAKVGAILQPARNRKGYVYINLCRGGTQKTVYIHRLVCEVFNGPPPSPDSQAAHTDDLKENNTSTNLYWATPLQNHADRRRNGRIVNGSRIGRAKLNEADVVRIQEMRKSGLLHREIAVVFGVAPHTVSRIVSGDRWGHMTASA